MNTILFPLFRRTDTELFNSIKKDLDLVEVVRQETGRLTYFVEVHREISLPKNKKQKRNNHSETDSEEVGKTVIVKGGNIESQKKDDTKKPSYRSSRVYHRYSYKGTSR